MCVCVVCVCLCVRLCVRLFLNFSFLSHVQVVEDKLIALKQAAEAAARLHRNTTTTKSSHNLWGLLSVLNIWKPGDSHSPASSGSGGSGGGAAGLGSGGASGSSHVSSSGAPASDIIPKIGTQRGTSVFLWRVTALFVCFFCPISC